MIIAAVRNERDMEKALQSGVEMIFSLSPNIMTLEEDVASAHAAGKKIFLHMDLAEGIGKDRSGLQYVKTKGVDGIISTTLEGIKASKPDMIEIMPGIVTKVIADLKGKLSIPIIAGGMINSRLEVRDALLSGATAISTSQRELWGKAKS